MQKINFVLMCGGVFLLSALYVTVGAQAPAAAKSANAGVYTTAQAKRGEALYKEQCATCHGDNLEGSGPMPPLAGKDFLTNWTGKTVGDLFEKTHSTMPATAPGTLTPAQAADITAHLLMMSRYPAGTAELESKVETLAQITLDAPAAGGAPAQAVGAGPGSTPAGAPAPAAAGKSVNAGVYTTAQAKRGEAIYKEQCATCHGDNLEGSGPMPPLAGKDFLTNWTGKTVGDLFEKTHTTMPATAPGTLTPAQAADVVAHMLMMSRYQPGTTELDSKVETLAQITLDAPAGSGAAAAPAATAPGGAPAGSPAPAPPTTPTTPTAPAPTAPAKP